jgi:outer membrane receptor protein involved in Fe transport
MLASAAVAAILVGSAHAESFNVPSGDLAQALDNYTRQSGVQLIISGDEVRGMRTKGVQGSYSADDALSRILSGTGLVVHHHPSGAIGIARETSANEALPDDTAMKLAQVAPPARGAVETVTVTSSKLGGADVQSIPIAITALSQEQLNAQKIEGGPDLLKSVPNMSFTKTNFSGYNIQIRGIGTQAVSVTTDPAVAVAFNDTPFIRNHFFEQEFFDVAQVEILRGPQGTLYGRNATGGVVNITSAKPTDQFEGQIKGEVGNYEAKRLSGFINIPIIGDKLDFRVAGALTDREGYDYNETTQHHVNGRKLWSTRATLSANPTPQLHADLIWEHFDENDDRSRTGKQLCHHDSGPENVGDVENLEPLARASLSRGCKPGSLYDADAFGTPNGLSIPFILAATTGGISFLASAPPGIYPDGTFAPSVAAINTVDPYGGLMQSTNMRTIASQFDPQYRAQSDTIEFNASYNITPRLTFYSQTGYNHDHLHSSQDYNRFNTQPIFNDSSDWDNIISDNGLVVVPSVFRPLTAGGIFCDPQLGCSKSIAGLDISQEHATQFSQEFRFTSNFEGPLNFSAGVNYTHYHTVEDYFVLFNLFTLFAESTYNKYPSTTECIPTLNTAAGVLPIGSPGAEGCVYIDPNPLNQINGEGHNYYRSQNPYSLNSYAAFGEATYALTDDLKLTGGIRYTTDHKTFTPIPTELLLSSYIVTGGTIDGGFAPQPDMKQHWGEFTGRAGVNWTPKLSWSDQTLVYGFYSRGYKAGGANPPGIGFGTPVDGGITLVNPVSPSYGPTFKPEFVNAYEIGSKNTLFNGSVTLNGDGFFYDYKNYQLSKIVDRTAVNENFDAHIWGLEGEATWEPVPGLQFNMSGGTQDSSLGKGSRSIDLMDRTDGNPDYMIIKPFPVLPSNCVIQKSLVEAIIANNRLAGPGNDANLLITACPGTFFSTPASNYTETQLPNGGQGFYKDLSGNELPNTPHFTLSLGAQYSVPLSQDWAALVRTDFYWQTNSWARVYNDNPYDVLHGWSNVNLTVDVLRNDGLQIEVYVKNIFDKTAITGAFLNSDDSALTTNVFTTDPRLIGFSITKSF